MKNTILKYTQDEVDDFIVSDYFSKKINIRDFIISHPNLFSSYKVMDDEKLENISYQLYGTTDYWDLLLILNDINPLIDMPYNSDTIIGGVTTTLNTYFNFSYSHAPMSAVAGGEVRINELTTEFNTAADILNEKFRYITVINPKLVPTFIKLLKDNKFI